MSSTLSIFSAGPGDEGPFVSSEVAPSPSPFDPGASSASSAQMAMETFETHINFSDEPHYLAHTGHLKPTTAVHQDPSETAPTCSLESPALSMSEDHPSIDSAQDHIINGPSPASNDSNSLSPSCILDLEEEPSSNNNAMKDLNLVSPLPSSLRLCEIELEHVPKANITKFAEESAVTNESHFSQQLLLSNLPSPAQMAPKFSLFSSSASNLTSTNLPVTEEKAGSANSEPQLDNSCDYPVMEPSSLFGTNQLTNQFTFTASKDSQCLPPPAPRPALAMLPSSESESELSAGPLTSMNHLLSSLSQNQNPNPVSASTKRPHDDESLYSDRSSDHDSTELLIPSSSPGKDDLPSSSPPNSSPPFSFSSSPLEPHSRVTVTDTNEAGVRHEQSAHHIGIYPSSPVIPWINHTSEIQSRLSPIPVASSPFQEKLSQDSQTRFKSLSEEHTDDSLHINFLSDKDCSLFNPVKAGSIASPVSLHIPSSPFPSSPPAREVCMTAVSSSPIPCSGINSSAMAFSSPPKKRKRDCEDEGSRSLPGSPSKPGKTQYVLPAPKRATVASQRRQHRKLVTPFKSPLMMTMAKIDNEAKEPRMSQYIAPLNDSIPNAPTAPAPLAKSFVVESKKKHFTTRAAAQFKSPLSSTGNANLSQNIRLTPSIQILERKIQILKRAVKVKKDNEERVLADLTTQWTDAGREVAWEVWELVKGGENSSSGYASAEKRSFQESWGWNGQGDEKRAKLEVGEESWGWNTTTQTQSTDEDAMQQEDEELRVKGQRMDGDEERMEYTLGSMLRHLGIDPATLGWNDEEGIFKDS